MTSLPPSPSAVDDRPVRTGMVLVIVLVSYFMIVLDNSIIFTGLPQIQAALHLTPAGLAWAQNAYTLVFGGLGGAVVPGRFLAREAG
ncbi:hypothetical protein BRM3_11415 [Brachybacterium huguangmaarense]|uniref:MFS transporter n=1 Tax=Brachybacterium huguangmaarense TaxID=1652028 RepID=A0ABY6FZ40_9MICO|nr:hypothetical protein [Brachybacterium huguangmaarense]UYG16218.1 hypothetical protein BRM3_11415 [Brachybacterium huguangmaarense]